MRARAPSGLKKSLLSRAREWTKKNDRRTPENPSRKRLISALSRRIRRGPRPLDARPYPRGARTVRTRTVL